MLFDLDPKTIRRVFVKCTLLSVTFALAVINNIVDQFYVTLNGINAAHAYTLDVPIYWILLSTATALSAVYAGEVGRHLKMGDKMSADVAAIRSIVYSIIFGFIFAVLISAVLTPILFAYIEDKDTMACAMEYLGPIVALYFFMSVGCVMGGIVNAEGRGRLYTESLVAAVITNICLGYVFVEILELGMFGNGLATAMGSMVSTLILLGFCLSGRTNVHLSLKNFSWSLDSVINAFARIRTLTIRLIIRYSAELAIRFTLYMSFALTYGIPMLFSALIAALGAGAGAYLSSEFSRLYTERRYDKTVRMFTVSMILGGVLLFILSMLLYIFAEPIATVFTIDSSLEEGKETLVWTMRVLCFTAPCLGLKYMISAVWTPIGKKEQSLLYEFVTQGAKVAIFVYALSFDFTVAIIALLVMRIASTVFAMSMAVVGIRTVYREHSSPTPLLA